MIDLYFEILSKPKAEITMIDEMIVYLPILIIALIFFIIGWLKEK